MSKIVPVFTIILWVPQALSQQPDTVDQIVSHWNTVNVDAWPPHIMKYSRKVCTINDDNIKSKILSESRHKIVIGNTYGLAFTEWVMSEGQLPRDNVVGFNTKYTFRLLKRPGSDEWLIEKFVQVGTHTYTQESDNVKKQNRQNAINVHYSYLLPPNNDLRKTLVDKQFKVNITAVQPVGLHVVYKRKQAPTGASAKGIVYQEGKADLLRVGNVYFCTVFDHTYDSPPPDGIGPRTKYKTKGVIDVDTTNEMYPFVKSSRSTVMTADKDKSLSETVSESQVAFTAHELESDCTLTAFGLPEPVGLTWSRPTPIYVWLLVAAAIAALVAFLLYRGRRGG